MYSSIFETSSYSKRGLRIFLIFFYKFDCPISIVAFGEPYSGVLNGTRVSIKKKKKKSLSPRLL